MKQKRINEKTIQCECGAIVRGVSEAHVEANLKNHKKSKKHKKDMRLLK